MVATSLEASYLGLLKKIKKSAWSHLAGFPIHAKFVYYVSEFTGDGYHMAGKFGGEFNLAVWRIMNAPPN